jgi:hypothetical protein
MVVQEAQPFVSIWIADLTSYGWCASWKRGSMKLMVSNGPVVLQVNDCDTQQKG